MKAVVTVIRAAHIAVIAISFTLYFESVFETVLAVIVISSQKHF